MDWNSSHEENASGRKKKLLKLEDELHQRVVGQEEAIQAVSDAVRRSRAGLQDMKPVGTFLSLERRELVKPN
jgi:ATP-dependent Clp protease ATP-binding subunit ClpB